MYLQVRLRFHLSFNSFCITDNATTIYRPPLAYVHGDWNRHEVQHHRHVMRDSDDT